MISTLQFEPAPIELRKSIQINWTRIALRASLGLCLLLSPRADAQDAPKMEAGVDYNYVHSNAPPGDCGCISMNGGDGWFAYNLTQSFSAVAQISAQHASNIGTAGADLTLTSYLVGPRIRRRVEKRFVPFAQALFGAGHASGSLAPGNFNNAGSPNAFAMTAGGGVDIKIGRHFAIRPADLDYYLTLFNNGVNSHQNNFRFSSGIVLRF